MKIYITFGQTHSHQINGVVYDKDTVAVLECNSHEEARQLIHELFKGEYFTTYSEESWDDDYRLAYFPKGYVELDAMLALQIIVHDFDLPTYGKKKSRAEFSSMAKVALCDYAKVEFGKNYLPTAWTKREIINRLIELQS